MDNKNKLMFPAQTCVFLEIPSMHSGEGKHQVDDHRFSLRAEVCRHMLTVHQGWTRLTFFPTKLYTLLCPDVRPGQRLQQQTAAAGAAARKPKPPPPRMLASRWRNHLERHADTDWTSTGTEGSVGMHSSSLFSRQTRLPCKRSLTNKRSR